VNDVAICIVSFNPDSEILDVLEAAARQSPSVFVIDNNSCGITRQRLARACRQLHATLIVNSENRGVAGALNQAAELAMNQGYGWMLILDQDSVPPANLVAMLMSEAGNASVGGEVAILCPLTVDSDWKQRQLRTGTPSLRPVESAWNAGSIIRLAAWKAVQGYDEGLFVDYVDHDFCFKCRQNGWKIVQAQDVVMIHSPGNPTRHRLLWKRPLTSNHSALRRYYIARNRILFYRRYWHFAPRWIAHDVYCFAKEVVAMIIYESDRLSKFEAVRGGIIDGLRGINGQVQRRPFISTGKQMCSMPVETACAPGSLSLILPCHNGTRWLGDLTGGLNRQTLRPSRVLACDDASTDATWIQLGRLLTTFSSQVQIGRHEHNMGVRRTVEELLTNIGTEYFALCDQDDVWLPDKLEKSVRLLESSGADLVYTDLRVVDEELHQLAPSMWGMSNIVPVSGHAVIPLIIKNSVTGCTVVARTSILKKALPLPPGIPMHDWWLGVVAAAGAGVAPLKEATVLYRQHGNNEIGAAQFGYRGLHTRLAHADKALGAYLVERIEVRCALIAGLQDRGLLTGPCFLSWFYHQCSPIRFLLNPVYLAYTTTHASVLGFRNLVVDWVLTCAPIAVRSPRRSP
jgi:rhamnosyltransferase